MPVKQTDSNWAFAFEYEAKAHGFVEPTAVYDDTMTEHKIKWVRVGRRSIDIRIHPYLKDAPLEVQKEIAGVLFDKIDDPEMIISFTNKTQKWIDAHRTPSGAVQ